MSTHPKQSLLCPQFRKADLKALFDVRRPVRRRRAMVRHRRREPVARLEEVAVQIFALEALVRDFLLRPLRPSSWILDGVVVFVRGMPPQDQPAVRDPDLPPV
eukprot:2118562-Pyramimonas_sp.AAC.1